MIKMGVGSCRWVMYNLAKPMASSNAHLGHVLCELKGLWPVLFANKQRPPNSPTHTRTTHPHVSPHTRTPLPHPSHHVHSHYHTHTTHTRTHSHKKCTARLRHKRGVQFGCHCTEMGIATQHQSHLAIFNPTAFFDPRKFHLEMVDNGFSVPI